LKRVLAGFLLVLMTASLTAQDFKGPYTEPLPYQEVEFPGWAHDVRRFEIIFFGSVPLTFIMTNLIYDFSLYAAHQFDSEYRMGSQRDPEDIKIMLLTTVSLSGAVALADLIIGKVKDSKKEAPEYQINTGPEGREE